MNKKIFRKSLILVVGFLLISISVFPSVASNIFLQRFEQPIKKTYKYENIMNMGTIIVPDDYPTIQEAINAANSDFTIYVRAGVYNENIVVDKMLLIKGDGLGYSIIDGNNKGTVVTIKSDGVKIMGFTIRNSGNPSSGIHLQSHYNNISYNCITNNYYGLYLYPSTGNAIRYNVITENNADGIWMQHSHGNKIDDNIISNNGNHGIFVDYSSLSNQIEHNYVGENQGNGINTVETSFGGIIKGNIIAKNTIGLNTIGGSDNNLFVFNELSFNDQNAFDSSMNSYDDGSVGNYWSDYTGVDNNGDGIGDTSYSVPGGTNGDNKPWIHPPSEVNLPPFPPFPPYGPTSVRVWSTNTYAAYIVDPNMDDQVYCQFDWGDNTMSSWIGPQSNPSIFFVTKTFYNVGTLMVMARGKDSKGNIGPWSFWLSVAVPKHKNNIQEIPFFEILAKYFPYITSTQNKLFNQNSFILSNH